MLEHENQAGTEGAPTRVTSDSRASVRKRLARQAYCARCCTRELEQSGRADRGTAALEVTVLGAVLLLPLCFAILAMASVQRTALAVAAAAREGGRIGLIDLARGGEPNRAHEVVQHVLSGYGLEPARASIEVDRFTDATGSLTGVRVEVSYPAELRLGTLGSVPLSTVVVSQSTFSGSRHISGY
jgi:Flp pilus assembly protein TadG